jgi:hypothetical protein
MRGLGLEKGHLPFEKQAAGHVPFFGDDRY